MDDPDLKALFIEESRKYLAALEAGAACLGENSPAAALKELIRCAHSMKGMAATMALGAIARESAQSESALRAVGSGARKAGPGLRDEILASVARTRALVEEYANG